jgi:serine/threonine protein kinase
MSSSTIPGLPAHYEVMSLIGRGGMARVWLARDTLLDREVAIKEIIPVGADPAQVRADVLREARTAVRVSNLHHRGVIRIHYIEDVKPNPLIVMEYVRGRSLEQVLHEDGPLTPERTRRVGLAVLSALQAAHSVGVLHRDVKPANILIGADGRIVLTDFGIAKIVNVATQDHSVQFQGTPAYVAPERLRNARASVAADLWSLGVTLYECLTGISPFARRDFYATLGAVAQHHPPAPPPTVGTPLISLINGLLQKDPANRLTADQAGHLLKAAPLSPTRVLEPPAPARTHRFPKIATLIAVLVLVAGGAYVWRADRPPADADLAALQAFAGSQSLASCKPAEPTSLQKIKRECDIGGGVTAYWILYQTPDQRNKRRDALPGCTSKTCESGEATGPDGKRGHYREFVTSDGSTSWAGLWWDDSVSSPGGATALEIHGPYDRSAKEPAAAVRALWNGWQYRPVT